MGQNDRALKTVGNKHWTTHGREDRHKYVSTGRPPKSSTPRYPRDDDPEGRALSTEGANEPSTFRRGGADPTRRAQIAPACEILRGREHPLRCIYIPIGVVLGGLSLSSSRARSATGSEQQQRQAGRGPSARGPPPGSSVQSHRDSGQTTH
jgi:hypothetical protein